MNVLFSPPLFFFFFAHTFATGLRGSLKAGNVSDVDFHVLVLSLSVADVYGIKLILAKGDALVHHQDEQG
jgi:hypothetical protein